MHNEILNEKNKRRFSNIGKKNTIDWRKLLIGHKKWK